MELIKNHLQGIATYPTTLLAMSKAELQSVRDCVGKVKAEGTYQNLYYSDKMLMEFVKDRGNEDISITAITEEMFEEYRIFLKKREYAASTINRYLCWLSRLIISCGQQEDYPLQFPLRMPSMRRRKEDYASCKERCNETYGNEDERQGSRVGTADVCLFMLHRYGYR